MIKNEHVIEMDFWGRTHSIDLVFRVFPDGIVDDIQLSAYEEFLGKREEILQEVYTKLKEYVVENYPDDEKISDFNIFRYYKPKAIFVKNSITQKRVIGIFFSFRFDMENDIVAYIEDEKVIEIGTQDIIL